MLAALAGCVPAGLPRERTKGRETWRDQCQAGEEEEGAVRWSSLPQSLSWLPLHQTEPRRTR